MTRDEFINKYDSSLQWNVGKDDFINDLYELLESYHQERIKKDEEDYEPYFGWCDVDGCENEGCSGGIGWRETGYWTLCYEHMDDFRAGKEQPKMKSDSILKENTRDKKTGYLPYKSNEP